MSSPGQRLRLLRESLGFTLRDVENFSARIAQKHKNEEYAIPLSRLSDMETKNVLPSMYRAYTLTVIYRVELCDMMSWYGIDFNSASKDLHLTELPKTHITEIGAGVGAVKMPTRMDPSFDLRTTSNLGRMIEKWGTVPLTYIEALSKGDYTYGYIGTEDYTMYPLLLPGSFIQVDESMDQVQEGAWRSEYERPIYFVETRDGHLCSWCSLKGDLIVLQPHPLSPAPVRIMKHPQEAEVIGQVVGIAMRLDQFSAPNHLPTGKAPLKLN